MKELFAPPFAICEIEHTKREKWPKIRALAPLSLSYNHHLVGAKAFWARLALFAGWWWSFSVTSFSAFWPEWVRFGSVSWGARLNSYAGGRKRISTEVQGWKCVEGVF